VVGAAGEEANVIFGAVIDPNMDGELLITVIATGFGQAEPRLRLVQQQAVRTAEETMVHPQAWGQSREQNQNGRKSWERTPRTESLDVPAFLRRQMD
jgi:cell division protein FtsZ